MPRPYPREFREDVIRVARKREPGVRLKVALVVSATKEWVGAGHELVVTGVVFMLALPLLVALVLYGGSASSKETPQRRTIRRGFYVMAVLFSALALWQATGAGVSNAGLIVGSILSFIVARLNTPKRR